ncbi:hypothetical protein [Bacillus smithii]|jgi:DNA mismatch repair ATPase MutS|uniref:hypothetical protein n=1 Tax=Bacillus smithii TaxID=1479 RepID=UPI002E1D76A2|nr:hypothetical protein [Bacillus smithii]MED4926570.1 hypothetical protein [Bacillus smithii]
MILKINKKTWELNHPSVDDVIEKINDETDSHIFFSHFIADGKEIYKDHELYLEDHLPSISELEVVLKTVKEFINDILLSASEYIQRAKSELPSLVDEFYDHADKTTWDRFMNFLEGLEWLNQMIVTIDATKQQPKNWDQYLNIAATLKEHLKSLQEALENQDEVLIADTIQYELLPLLEELEKEINTTIDQEGYRYDIS